MQYRNLGASGVLVSAIGLGMAAIGRPGYINLGHGDDLTGSTSPSGLEDHAGTVMDAALDVGITYFDAARSYGKAEEFVSRWLASRGVQPADVVVGSKWGYVYTADWTIDADVHEVKIHTRENLDRQHVESMALLSGYLRLYQIHSATLDSGVLDDPGVVERLAEIRDGGLIVGLSTSGPAQADTIRRALGVEVGGRPVFGAVQSTWNLLEPSAGPALAEAADAGLGVIVKEAVANGRLTARNSDLAARISEIAKDWSLDAIAIAACLNQSWSSVVLSGAATAGQLESNVGALTVPPDTLDTIPSLAEDPNDYWGTRSSLAWG